VRRDVAGQLEVPPEVRQQHGVPEPRGCSCQNPFIAIKAIAAASGGFGRHIGVESLAARGDVNSGKGSAPHGRQCIDALDEAVHLDALVGGPVQEVAALQPRRTLFPTSEVTVSEGTCHSPA
jgi:hypothetical protein